MCYLVVVPCLSTLESRDACLRMWWWWWWTSVWNQLNITTSSTSNFPLCNVCSPLTRCSSVACSAFLPLHFTSTSCSTSPAREPGRFVLCFWTCAYSRHANDTRSTPSIPLDAVCEARACIRSPTSSALAMLSASLVWVSHEDSPSIRSSNNNNMSRRSTC